jgi:hypothetical protein
MSDLALLGMRFETHGAEAAERHLDAITDKSERAERATDSLSDGFGRAGTATGHMDEQLIRSIKSQEEAIRHAKNLGGALGNLAGDAATGGASLDSMATNGARAATSLIGLGSGAVVAAGAVSLLVGTIGVGVAAWLDAEKTLVTLDRAASGLGRTAGLTGVELQRLAIAAADQGNISVRSAEEQAAAYISTGRIGSEMISQLIADSKDLAAFLGKDLPDATTFLAKSMEDPAKAAEDMTRQFGLLTQAQIEEIKKAQEAGDAYRAQKILMDALSGAAEGHAGKVGVMTSAWDALAKAAQDAWSWMGRALYLDENEKLEKIMSRRQRYETALQQNGSRGLTTGLARVQYEQDTQAMSDILGARSRREASDARAVANQQAQIRADAATTRTARTRTGGSGLSQGDRDQANLIRQSQQLIEQLEREAQTYGLTWEQLARYNAEKQIAELASGGFTAQETQLAAAIREATEAMIAHRKVVDGEKLDALPRVDIRPLDVPEIKLVDELQLAANELRLVNDLARDAGYGMAEAFGASGSALAGLLVTATDYQSRLVDIKLAVRDKTLTEAQGARDAAIAQVQAYGDMLGSAKMFFAEGSDGYRALQAAEAAYRVFQFAMSVQAMAQGAAETSAHVAQSGVKASASTAAGAAKMFEQLGPYAFPVVAAMIALLASLGLKGKGGGGGSASPSLDGSVAKSQGYSQQADATQSAFAASVAQKVEVRVTADRDGLNAYVAQTAREEATPLVMQGMAAASGATRAQVMSDLDKGRTYSRGG